MEWNLKNIMHYCLLLGNWLFLVHFVSSFPPPNAPHKDHIKGLPLERDGDLNPKFRKEIILGNMATEPPDPIGLLTKIFKRADANQDQLLTIHELQKWIGAQIKAHFTQAVQDNLWTFTSLDKNHDGRVSWSEYHSAFLKEHGFPQEFIANHSEAHRQLPRLMKEKILLDKAAWSEAANSDSEALNIDEFLTFRHPEHSHVALLNTVNAIIENLDENGDGTLSLEEFVEGAPENIDQLSRQIPEKQRRAERRREFTKIIDMNKDGKVTRQELLVYNDPENPLTAYREARRLFLIADINKDEKLSLQEVLNKQELFLGSKMVDTARSFHDEF